MKILKEQDGKRIVLLNDIIAEFEVDSAGGLIVSSKRVLADKHDKKHELEHDFDELFAELSK